MTVTVVQLLVSGVAVGFLYGLVAVGITLIWNAASVLNFANGQVAMLTAYLFGVIFMNRLKVIPGALVTIAIIAAFGIFIATVIFIPLREMSRLCMIVTTFMLGLSIAEVARLVFGSIAIPVTPFIRGIFKIGGIVIARVYVYIIVIGIILAFTLQYFLTKTKAGNAMQCVSQNRTAAALMGINIPRYMKYTVAMGFAISAIVGILLIPLFDLSLHMASMAGLKGFASAVAGGFGSLPGALAGGIIIGILENLGGLLISAGYKDAIAFVLLIIFLVINPMGLTGLFAGYRIKGEEKPNQKMESK